MRASAKAGDVVGAEKWICDQVAKKQAKGGAAYARGKMLVVWNMLSNNASWHPNRVARVLPPTLIRQTRRLGWNFCSDLPLRVSGRTLHMPSLSAGLYASVPAIRAHRPET